MATQRWRLGAVGLLLWLVATVGAQPLSVEVVPGFDGVCPQGGCYPVTVWIRGERNVSPPVLAQVQVRVSGWEVRANARQTVSLPSGQLSMPISFLVCHPPTLNELDFTAQVVLNGRPLAVSKAVTATASQWSPVVVSLGTDQSAFSSLDQQAIPLVQMGDRLFPSSAAAPLVSSRNSRVLVGRVRFSLPPSHGVAYRGVTAVSLDDRPWDTLTQSQQRAIADYVWAGGLLVVHGVDLNRLQTLQPSGLLPVEPLGITQVSTRALRQWIPNLPEASMDVVRARPVGESWVLWREGDLPLVVVKRKGFGQVVFLAFDPSQPIFSQEQVARALWQQILSLRAETFVAPGGLFPSDPRWNGRGQPYLSPPQQHLFLIQALMTGLTGTPLPVGWLAAYLGGYVLLLIPLNYVILRRVDKLHWSWFTLPLLAIGLSVGTYAAARQLQAGINQLRSWTVIYVPSGASYGILESDVLLYSATSARYTLQSLVEGCLVESSPPSLQASRTEETSQQILPRLEVVVPVWSARSFHLSSTTTLSGRVDVSVERKGGVHLKVFNRTPYRLRQLYLISANGSTAIAQQIEPNGSLQIRLDRSTPWTPLKTGRFTKRTVDWRDQAMVEWIALCGFHLREGLFLYPDAGERTESVFTPAERQGILVATVEMEQPLLRVTPEIRTKSQHTLLAVHFEVN